MNQTWADVLESIRFTFGYNPQNSGYDAGVLREMNTQADRILTSEAWPFLITTATLTARGDYFAGTADLTFNSNSVVGTGTAWTSTMEGAWIAPGSGPEPQEFVRIGRVASPTQIFLVNPYRGATAVGSAYRIRWRFLQMPRDCASLEGIGPGENNQTVFDWLSAQEAEERYFTERNPSVGRPYILTPANPPVWDMGMGQPRTPDTAPTGAAVAGGSLPTGHVIEHFYTWLVHGTETGRSPTVQTTVSGGNLTVRLTNILEAGGTSGFSARLYRRDVTAGTPAYHVGDYSGVTTIDDDGSTTDKTIVYYDNNSLMYIRPWPRGTDGDAFDIDVRYHRRPRLIQATSDYIELPRDCIDAIKYSTMAELAVKFNAAGVAATASVAAQKALTALRAKYIVQRPGELARRGVLVPDLSAYRRSATPNFRQIS